MNKLEEYLSAHEVSEIHPSDIAKILKQLDESEFAEALKLVPKDLVGDVALALPDRYFDDVVENLSVDELRDAVSALESDDQVDFLHELEEVDESIASKVFDTLDEEDKKEIIKLQTYGDDEAGAYMQLEVFTADKNEVVHDVIKRFAALRRAKTIENIQNLFITSSDKKLLFAVGLDDLLVFDFNKTLIENIEQSEDSFEPKKAQDREDIRDVVHYFEEYDLSVMPIINSYGVLLGRITSDDIYDIINEHATEQMYNLAGLDDDAEEDDEIYKAGKKRASWLGVNLFTAIFASFVIGIFADTLESMVALAVLMPIVASMGGNAGTQSLTVVVRQLALGDISKGDAMRIIKKEVLISLMNGVFFAIIMGVVAAIWFNMKMLGVVIALSMIINLFMAGLFGAAIPLFLKKIDVDPAIGSAVILTTVTDVVGFFSFLALATYILL
ncbi:MAG: magnesium transporter [Sulfurimonas sp. RIFOXYD12_FULL_33_39]|uniref:magnesium transporter n=1 Tax=unclassified Sulfurimonas TaxID=2623549 RepID=UPI0008B6A6CC|nr:MULTISPECIES: magnesium transporter [unclassified Sulfurimonas]OHE01805.1 MAG: magnesium transporter [Sulfurimonas sp. RIFCSPLOWO2_12_FULL_34_6]OHE09890.1 MAG: magnesium transporter [Sulfurimonas sp. RIFOXYD12_FULL_33_39]OHE13602.1 MAG: magnesium transporter [Sulfurimonas sp. RIFOXYD2_FULL_34_21]DAB28205.1 MAG TPA: magnesium transporter [Sulfurimonas sp. UBA10385]